MPTQLNWRADVVSWRRQAARWRNRQAATAAVAVVVLGISGCATLKTPSVVGGKNAATRSLSAVQLREVAATFEAQGHTDRAERLYAAADRRSGVLPNDEPHHDAVTPAAPPSPIPASPAQLADATSARPAAEPKPADISSVEPSAAPALASAGTVADDVHTDDVHTADVRTADAQAVDAGAIDEFPLELATVTEHEPESDLVATAAPTAAPTAETLPSPDADLAEADFVETIEPDAIEPEPILADASLETSDADEPAVAAPDTTFALELVTSDADAVTTSLAVDDGWDLVTVADALSHAKSDAEKSDAVEQDPASELELLSDEWLWADSQTTEPSTGEPLVAETPVNHVPVDDVPGDAESVPQIEATLPVAASGQATLAGHAAASPVATALWDESLAPALVEDTTAATELTAGDDFFSNDRVKADEIAEAGSPPSAGRASLEWWADDAESAAADPAPPSEEPSPAPSAVSEIVPVLFERPAEPPSPTQSDSAGAGKASLEDAAPAEESGFARL